VGNPGTENDWFYNIDEYAFVTFMYNHALIPQANYSTCVAACGWDSFLTNCSNIPFVNPSPQCQVATKAAISYLPSVIDLYDIYAPVCHSTDRTKMQDMYRYTRQWNRVFQKYLPHDVPYVPCIDNYLTDYLNQETVQNAIHAKSMQWNMFSNKITYWPTNAFMNDYWKNFTTTTNLDIMIYSGDADSAVPFIGTQRWIKCLGQPVKRDWHSWEWEQQTAGSMIEYEGITFLTVKGCGHMVPLYCDSQAYGFFASFIQGTQQKAIDQ